MNLLEVQNICSGYSGAEILHGISLHVQQNEIVTIIGPNGCGKSTLLKTIMGHLAPTKGAIIFNERDISGLRPDQNLRRGIGYVPQLENIFPSLSVLENLEMGGFLFDKAKLKERLEKVFELFPKVKERLGQTAGTLSGGERQMVAMGAAFMAEPRLVLLDEPSAGLSPAVTTGMFDKITELNRLGTTILIVEQNAYESLEISNRGYVLAMGQNVFDGQAHEILKNDKIGKTYLGG